MIQVISQNQQIQTVSCWDWRKCKNVEVRHEGKKADDKSFKERAKVATWLPSEKQIVP